jgi:hypothetical protein
MMFGGIRPNGALSYPALILQITIFIYALIISLENFGLMSQQIGYHYLSYSTIILGLLVFIYIFIRK